MTKPAHIIIIKILANSNKNLDQLWFVIRKRRWLKKSNLSNLILTEWSLSPKCKRTFSENFWSLIYYWIVLPNHLDVSPVIKIAINLLYRPNKPFRFQICFIILVNLLFLAQTHLKLRSNYQRNKPDHLRHYRWNLNNV